MAVDDGFQNTMTEIEQNRVSANLHKDEISDLRSLFQRVNQCHMKKFEAELALAKAETDLENELVRLQFRREKK